MTSFYGKKVLNHVYWHYSLTSSQASEVQEKVTQAEQLANLIASIDYNVVKFNQNGQTLSLLNYPQFFESAFPELTQSWKIDFLTQQVQKRSYQNSANPPILHRKEQLLPANHPQQAEFLALTCTAEQLGLFDDTLRIGFKRAWQDLIAEKGFQLIGNQFIPLANLEANETNSAEISPSSTAIERHLTALSRANLSAPMQALARYGFLDGQFSLFDYGCGKGDDVRNLRANNITANGWDPYYAADNPQQTADLVNLGFVINVIENYQERCTALTNAYQLAEQVLIVSAMLLNQNAYNGERLNDGVRTQRNTFQKYYTQNELKSFIETQLANNAIPVAPGIFFVFKNADAEQNFLFNRQRSQRNLSIISRRDSSRIKINKADKLQAKYQKHAELLENLWFQCLELGRLPDKNEAVNLIELSQHFGSVNKAVQFLMQVKDFQLLELQKQNRIADLLTYFALQLFSKRPAYKHLPAQIQQDIKAFFGDYHSAQLAAQKLLFQISDTTAISQSCQLVAENGDAYLNPEQALIIHSSLVNNLPPLLRVYIGCSGFLYGDISHADLIKIHSQSGKLTLLKFDDFMNKPIPKLLERVKINLRSQEFTLFQYGNDYPSPNLYFKSRYINENFDFYAQQLAFDEQLDSLQLFDLSGYGESAANFEAKLNAARWQINAFKLERSQTIPDLDALCGQYLTYRQLIECGETQQKTGLANLPQQPDSYTALYELACHILDPVIDYFGMIELTYGFCSPQLAKQISGRIAPKLDQHAAHELNRNNNFICPRLGAAVDFIVRDEDMREVAEWIRQNTDFDRLYFYGNQRPIHVSYAENPKHEWVDMLVSATGGVVPKVRRD